MKSIIISLTLLLFCPGLHSQPTDRKPMAVVKQNGLYGVIDIKGEIVIPFKYENITRVHPDFFLVKTNGDYILIDSKGEIKIDYHEKYLKVGNFYHNGYAIAESLVTTGDDLHFNFGLMDENRIVISAIYENAEGFGEGLVPVKPFGSQWGYVNLENKFEISPRFDWAIPFSEGLAAAKKDSLWGFIDHTGFFVIPPQFDTTKSFSEGLCAVKHNGKYGYIDKTGMVVCDFRFNMAQDFHDSLAAVNSDGEEGIERAENGTLMYRFHSGGKWGYINRKGEIEIPVSFKYASDFNEGYAHVIENSKVGLINTSGVFMFPPTLTSVGKFSCGIAPVRKSINEKYGYINENGDWILPPVYDSAEEFK